MSWITYNTFLRSNLFSIPSTKKLLITTIIKYFLSLLKRAFFLSLGIAFLLGRIRSMEASSLFGETGPRTDDEPGPLTYIDMDFKLKSGKGLNLSIWAEKGQISPFNDGEARH